MKCKLSHEGWRGKSKVIESYQLKYTKQMNIKRDYNEQSEFTSEKASELKY